STQYFPKKQCLIMYHTAFSHAKSCYNPAHRFYLGNACFLRHHHAPSHFPKPWTPTARPRHPKPNPAMIDILIDARRAPLTPGLEVARILPFRKRRMVGPFIFLDHAGPVTL